MGLASIEIFGYDDPRTREYAVELGLALQLTNILRDVGADAARDRLYLPLEDLARFRRRRGRRCSQCARDAPARRGPPGLDALLVVRGRACARRTTPRRPRCCRRRDRRSMLAAEIMGAVYRAAARAVGARAGMPVGGPNAVSLAAAQGLDRRCARSRACTGALMKVVVVGGGFAGFAAAVALQERRHEVVLLERRGVLGGRATSSRDAVTGEDVDNGTHLMVGAYRATLDARPARGRRATCCSSRRTSGSSGSTSAA